jgi:hypothetical protein
MVKFEFNLGWEVSTGISHPINNSKWESRSVKKRYAPREVMVETDLVSLSPHEDITATVHRSTSPK